MAAREFIAVQTREAILPAQVNCSTARPPLGTSSSLKGPPASFVSAPGLALMEGASC
jgi:hypothetical protein